MALSLPAEAVPIERAYDRSVELIERLYMYPDEITPMSLVQAATDHLSRKIHWLMVDHQQRTTHVRHGNGALITSITVNDYEEVPDALRQLENAISSGPYDFGDIDLRLELLSGIAMGLDRYSRVLAGDRLKNFDVRLKGTLVGIGATLRSEDGHLVVISRILGGPADLVGIQNGDFITRIDDSSTINMPLREATRRIQGEVGTAVAIEILRAGEPISLTITRAKVTIPNVTHDLLDEGIGYIKISHISQKTVTNLKASLSSLLDIGGLSRGLIIDLRGNTGGSMKEAARSADEFLKEGLLLRTAGPNGAPVPNLQGRMDAVDSNAEPPIPIAVLIDQRTASGAEILAGALLEHERAVLIGARSYGKGSVQKIYNLDENTRLKLTVAEYILANDRKINHVGLDPDIHIRFIDLNEYGLRFRGPPPPADWNHVLPVIREAESWNGRKDEPRDLPLELARRALSTSKGHSRAATLTALQHQVELEANKQRGHLLSALEEHNLNWSAGVPDEKPIQASVKLQSVLSNEKPNVLNVLAIVENRGELPLGQVMVHLGSEQAAFWNEIVIPLGLIEAGGTARGETQIPLRTNISIREDSVVATLRAAGRPALVTEAQDLVVQSDPMPLISVEAKLHIDSETPTVDVRIKNFSKRPLFELAAYLEYPQELPIELLDRASTLATLASGQESQLRLRILPKGQLPKTLPLTLVVESKNYGKLADWTLQVPVDGSPVRAIAPRVTDAFPNMRTATGTLSITFAVTDDRSLEYALVYLNGEKIAWHGRQDRALGLQISADIKPGQNIFVVVTEDDQGIKTRYQRIIQGDEPAAVDAQEPGP
jgi:carboxyl-terminal processing protease